MCPASPVRERTCAGAARPVEMIFTNVFLLQLLLLPLVATAWDIAVAVNHRVELMELANNGSALHVDSIFMEDSFVTALALNPRRNELYFSDSRKKQPSIIYSVILSQPQSKRPLVQEPEQNFKIYGMVYDNTRNFLYWTNGAGMQILFLDLNNSNAQRTVLHKFPNRNTRGITLDHCSRTLIWTSRNNDEDDGYIESSSLDGAHHQILLRHIHNPTDIIVDQPARKLYWCDDLEGIYFQIERSNLDGTVRERVVYNINHNPHSLTITSRYLYWTDVANKAIWRDEKSTSKTGSKHTQVRTYNSSDVKDIISWESMSPVDCSLINRHKVDSIEINARQNIPPSKTQAIEVVEVKSVSEQEITRNKCLNGGIADENLENKCNCIRGYQGQFCEIPTCFNYCVNGECYVDVQGFAQCSCYSGYHGARCEHDICDNYCLNGGRCSIGNRGETVCMCTGDYQGRRCEVKCSQFCKESHIFVSVDPGIPSLCSCSTDGVYQIVTSENVSLSQPQTKQKDSSLEIPLVISLTVVGISSIIFLCIIVLLAMKVQKLQKRPRIKKRIIVNKNITPTPLTSRPPPPADQCEITIENCCNMNICETPCYEPQLRVAKTVSKTEEKKNLLGNMEDGESCSPCQDTLY